MSTSIEYTSEELSFLKERSGKYAKSILGQVFLKDEYNDPSLDNFVKQEYIQKAFTAARAAAKSDLLYNQDDTSEEYEEYPEFIIDDEAQGFSVNALGAYENSNDLRLRIDTEVRKNFLNEIRTRNQGEPLSQADDQYFQTIEE